MSIFFTIVIVSAAGWTYAQPIIPTYAPRYQLVYLPPSYQQLNQYPLDRLPLSLLPQPMLNNRVFESDNVEDSVESNVGESVESSVPDNVEENVEDNVEDSVESNVEDSVEEEKVEVSQFHSEDADGRVVFGFHSPNQIRMEARDADGTVRGSYSYIDPTGNVVKVQYWDDGSGFHAAGNNIPVAIHQPPDFTPEVKAARENHLRLYEAALRALKAAALNQESDNDGGSYIDTSNYEGNEYEEDAPPEGGVIIENPAPPSSVYADNLHHHVEYPKVQYLPQYNQLSNDAGLNHHNHHNHHHHHPHYSEEDDKESVSIENPDYRRKIWKMRKGKSDMAVRPVYVKAVVEDESVSKPEPVQSVQGMVASPRMDEILPAVPAGNVETKSTGNRAFYYHFTHTIPKPVERVDISEETRAGLPAESVSVKAQNVGGIPVAAVHDVQMSPMQRSAVPNFQLYPVYLPEQN